MKSRRGFMRYVGRFMRYVLCDIQGMVHEVWRGFMRYVGGFMRYVEGL